MAVAVVVDERAAVAPSFSRACDPSFFADVGEGAVAIVVVQDIFSVVGDVEIFEAVVIVVADTHALSPTGVQKAGFLGDVGKGAVVIVVVEVAGLLVGAGKRIESGAIDDENVGPAVIVIIKNRDTGAGGFDDVLFCVFAAEDYWGGEAGFSRDVGEVRDWF